MQTQQACQFCGQPDAPQFYLHDVHVCRTCRRGIWDLAAAAETPAVEYLAALVAR